VTVSIGSTVPSQREIDVSVVAQSDLIVCDMLHEVIDETGDMIAARAAGIEVVGKCHGIGSLIAGDLDAQAAAARYPMFKSVGGGLQDVVVAGMLLDRARDAGLVTELPIAFSTKLV
jgi:ornithine cyclodeaminase/alanine dehydrogenase